MLDMISICKKELKNLNSKKLIFFKRNTLNIEETNSLKNNLITMKLYQ